MSPKPGRYKIIDQFIADGMTFMFGNPGTVEQGFLSALDQYPAMKYILALQESVAVMMADGYARATHRPTLVQLHSSPGIGNGVGALYQAKRGHSPLVVIGGDAGRQYMNLDAQMAADLLGIMEPVTKYATMVLDPRSLLRTLRRAIKIAATPPMGPVYVCLPMDILDALNDEEVFPTVIPSTRVQPESSLLEEAARMLLAADRPMIFVGDGVAYSEAVPALEQIASLLGAEVWGVDGGDVDCGMMHPCYQGSTGHMFGKQSLSITEKGDVNLIVGTYMMPEVFPELGRIYAPQARTIHIDLNAYEIAKNHPVDIGLVSDPKLSLERLTATIQSLMNPSQEQKAVERLRRLEAAKEENWSKTDNAYRALPKEAPLHIAHFARALAEKAPRDLVVFDEALTNSPPLTHYFPAREPGQYFVTRGGSLGVGIPGCLGVKLAHPEKKVVTFTGDGAAMYTIQALWTATRHRTGGKFVICNNGSYRLLQSNITAYWSDQGLERGAYPLCFDLSQPPIDFVALAKAMGVTALRVSSYQDIEPAVERMLEDDQPFLIDLMLEGENRPDLIGIRCGQ